MKNAAIVATENAHQPESSVTLLCDEQLDDTLFLSLSHLNPVWTDALNSLASVSDFVDIKTNGYAFHLSDTLFDFKENERLFNEYGLAYPSELLELFMGLSMADILFVSFEHNAVEIDGFQIYER